MGEIPPKLANVTERTFFVAPQPHQGSYEQSSVDVKILQYPLSNNSIEAHYFSPLVQRKISSLLFKSGRT